MFLCCHDFIRASQPATKKEEIRLDDNYEQEITPGVLGGKVVGESIVPLRSQCRWFELPPPSPYSCSSNDLFLRKNDQPAKKCESER